MVAMHSTSVLALRALALLAISSIVCAQNSDALTTQIEQARKLAEAGDIEPALGILDDLVLNGSEDARVHTARIGFLVALVKDPARAPGARPRLATAARDYAQTLPDGPDKSRFLELAESLVAKPPADDVKNAARVELTDIQRIELNTAAAELQSTGDERSADSRKALFESVMKRTLPVSKAAPDLFQIWQLRAISSLELGLAKEGRKAALELLRLGAARSEQAAVQKLMVLLNGKGWLEAPEVSLPRLRAKLTSVSVALSEDKANLATRLLGEAELILPDHPELLFHRAKAAAHSNHREDAVALMKEAYAAGFSDRLAIIGAPEMMELFADVEASVWLEEAYGRDTVTQLAVRRRAEHPMPGFTRARQADLDPQSGLPVRIQHDATGITLVLVLAGSFQMGSPESEKLRDGDEPPRQEVIEKSFYLGETEVSQAQWRQIMPSHSSAFPQAFPDTSDLRNTDRSGLPVETVSWRECQEFCAKCPGLRLPTETEWEYACRAGTQTPFSFGSTILSSQVNFDGRQPYPGGAASANRDGPMPVGSLPPNPWGFREMHGNVWEWCADAVGPADAKRRVLRGGSWGNCARACRSADRGSLLESARSSGVGFRVAAEVPWLRLVR